MTSSSSPSKSPEHQHWKPQAVSTAVCFVATLAGWALPHLGLASAALPSLVLAYVAGGWESLLRTGKALRRLHLDVDLLMLIAAVGAAVVGHWVEGAILLFLFSLGNTLETFAFGRTRRSIRALMELRPEQAAVVGDDGTERVVPLDEVEPGTVVRVRPGERIPVDGDVVEGASHVDESTLTGESAAVRKEEGDEVFAGTLNQGGSMDVRMTRPASDTQLARVITLVEQAQEARAPTQSWIERLEGRYAAAVILGSAVAILIPWLFLGWSFHDALYRGMTLLVVASPCALVISIPATVVSAVSNGARHGILFKGGAHLDALATIRVAAFDKTGTLTRGRPEVVAVRPWKDLPVPAGVGGDADEAPDTHLLTLAAAAEARSEHPLSSAILREAERRGCRIPDPNGFDSSPGHGVQARVEGLEVLVGRRSWIEEVVGSPVPEQLSGLFQDGLEGATPVYVAVDGRHAGVIAIADTPREGAREVVEALSRRGIAQTAMLTGDAHTTARAIGREVGMSQIHAELLPDEKSSVIEALRRAHGPVAMIGDGVNDAPALASADLGIAVGAAGSDVALETADIVVLGEDLGALAHAVDLSYRTRRIVRQNLIFALAVMVTLVILAGFGLIGLTTGVIGHEGSTVVVVFNGLRLLQDGYRPPVTSGT